MIRNCRLFAYRFVAVFLLLFSGHLLQAREPVAVPNAQTLFPLELPAREWVEFAAQGYKHLASGIIFTSLNGPSNGMPIGALDSGCIDIEADGTLGYCSIFNSHIPRRGPLNLPFLGIAHNQRVHVLSTQKMIGVTVAQAGAGETRRIVRAKEIHYWGHYPVLDMEFELDAPLSVGLRAFAPFVPGDIAISNTPGAVFDVYLRNTSDTEQAGRLAFSFPGPTANEAGRPMKFERHVLNGEISGVTVTNGEDIGFTLAVDGAETITTGACLGVDASNWAALANGLQGFYRWHIGHRIPEAASTDAGTTLVVDFSLKAREEEKVRFILSWYSPIWLSGGNPAAEGREFSHMYATRYKNSEDIARLLRKSADDILARIVAWQEVVYTEERLPVWLRESLINNLYHITEDGLWAQAKPPIGEWCRPEDGIFGLIEDPRNCPQIEVIPCAFYGNIPIVYFFPELALSTLRAEKAYQLESGDPTWVFGGPTLDATVAPFTWIGKEPTGVEPCEFAWPGRGYQFALNASCLVDITDRLLLRMNSKALVDEFYPMVKKATLYNMNLRPGYGTRQIISLPTNNEGGEWFEGADWFGMTTHVGGIHLAQLLMTERIAKAAGDVEFADQCREWYEEGTRIMEEEMWAGTHYLLYNEPETGRKSNLVFGYTFDGEWMACQHGFSGVFRPDRVKKTLETIRRTALVKYGALIWARPEGGPPTADMMNPSYFSLDGVHVPSVMMLAMTYMYKGEREFGLELARKSMHTLACEHGSLWDTYIFISGETGAKLYGNDYYQNMVLWSIPSALEGKGLDSVFSPGGLVERIIEAGKSLKKRS